MERIILIYLELLIKWVNNTHKSEELKKISLNSNEDSHIDFRIRRGLSLLMEILYPSKYSYESIESHLFR